MILKQGQKLIDKTTGEIGEVIEIDDTIYHAEHTKENPWVRVIGEDRRLLMSSTQDNILEEFNILNE